MIDLKPYLDLSTMMVLATKDNQWNPYISNVYFGYNYENYTCYFISRATREHSKHILENNCVAWSIIDTNKYSSEDKDKKALQFQWKAVMLEWENAEKKYQQFYEKRIWFPKFPDSHYVFECRPAQVKIWDEELYGWEWKVIKF